MAAVTLPNTDETPLVRVDFTATEIWQDIVARVRKPNESGFFANVAIIDDVRLSGCNPVELASSLSTDRHPICIFADTNSMTHTDHPLLCVNLDTLTSLRVVPDELWSVESNLSLANLDFEEFVAALDKDGIFRGF